MSTFRYLAISVVATILCLAGSASSKAQTCYDCPGNSTEQTVNVNICIGGTTYNVNVSYCTKLYSPPSATAPCSNNTYRADAATSIRKICPGSTAIPADLEKTIRAVYCAISPKGQNIFGITVPDCPGVYCWTIQTPKCWQISNACYVPCDTDKCCSAHWRICKDPMTGNIVCNKVELPCSDGRDCTQGCTQINCDNLDFCTCPSCF